MEYSVYLRVIGESRPESCLTFTNDFNQIDEDFDQIVPNKEQSVIVLSPSHPTTAYELDSLSKDETEVSANQAMVKKTGSNVRFKCGVSSTPKTSIIWLHNNQQLSESEPRRGRNSLVINDLKPEDSGNYTCVAISQFGTVTQTYIIKVIGKCSSEILGQY